MSFGIGIGTVSLGIDGPGDHRPSRSLPLHPHSGMSSPRLSVLRIGALGD